MNDVASLVGSVKDYQGLECVVYHNSKNEKKKKGEKKKNHQQATGPQWFKKK